MEKKMTFIIVLFSFILSTPALKVNLNVNEFWIIITCFLVILVFIIAYYFKSDGKKQNSFSKGFSGSEIDLDNDLDSSYSNYLDDFSDRKSILEHNILKSKEGAKLLDHIKKNNHLIGDDQD